MADGTPDLLLAAARNARAGLDAYLAANPGEAARLAALDIQLRDDGGAIFSRSNMRGHITTSAFVVDATITRTLLIDHAALGLWLQPGGHYEAMADGQLWRSALREVREETGVVAELFATMPFDIDTHAIPARPSRQEGEHCHHDLTFLALADPDAQLSAQLDEVHAARWFPLASVTRHSDVRMRRLAHKAIALR